MVHIILLILKIAGIVLLSLLGILILLVLMVLFVPVRYNISADYHSRLTAKVKISWLLNVLRLKVSYDNDLSVKAYALFFKILDNNSDKAKKQKNREADKYIDDMYGEDSGQDDAGQYAGSRQNEAGSAGNSQDTAVQVEALEAGKAVKGNAVAEKAVADKKIVADEALEKTDEKASRSTSKEKLEEITKEADTKPHKESESNSQHNNDDKQSVSQPHKKKGLISRLKAAFNSVKDRLISIKNKLKKFIKAIADKKRSAEPKINDLKAIINDEENKLVRLIKKELKELIKEITPVKYDVNVRYGCEEPYMTGRILGVLAVVYGITGVQFNITPEFEQKVLEGDIYMKGRVRIYRLLLIALRMYKNNRFRKLVFNKG